MAKSENKTQPTDVDPQAFIQTVEPPERKRDAETLLALFTEVTGSAPYMYGGSIVGFDSYHYHYESGRQGDAPRLAFSPRKPQMVVYLVGGYEEIFPDLLSRLGPYKIGKSCLYLKDLAANDMDVLKELARASYERMKEEHPD